MKLTEQRKAEIIKVINTLLTPTDKEEKIDIVKLAVKNGFTVYPLKETANVDGLIVVNNRDESIDKNIPYSKVIAFKSSLTEEQNRFIIAHELGHYYLHNKYEEIHLYAKAYHLGPAKNDQEEIEADFFAANLLVPEETFKKQYESHDCSLKDSLIVREKLAHFFGVSTLCINKRIKEIYEN